MDDKNLEELKKEAVIDNSRLEELMREEITPEMQMEFLEILKDSKLFLPVDFGPDAYVDIEGKKPGDVIDGPSGFSIQFLTDEDGNNAVPLFTSEEMMEKVGIHTSVMVMYMSDLAGMLEQTDKYSIIAINPFTEHDLNMPIEAFLALFEEISPEEEEFLETLTTILDVLKNKSVELEDDLVLFVRDEVNFMKEDAVDGVFIPEIPFNVSTREDFLSEFKYLNVLIMPKGKKFVYTGHVVGEDSYDAIIAPGTEFHFEKDIDEFTSVWKCGAQPFYDE